MWESCDSSKFPTPAEFRQLLRNATVAIVPLAVPIVSSDGSTAACAGVDLKLASAGDDISGHSDSAATVAAADVVLRTSVVCEVRHRSC